MDFSYLNNPFDITGTTISEKEVAQNVMRILNIETPEDMYRVSAVVLYLSDDKFKFVSPKILEAPQTLRFTFASLTADCEDFTRVYNAMTLLFGYPSYMVAMFFGSDVGHAIPVWKQDNYWYSLNYFIYTRSKDLDSLVMGYSQWYPMPREYFLIPAHYNKKGDIVYDTKNVKHVVNPTKSNPVEIMDKSSDILKVVSQFVSALKVNDVLNVAKTSALSKHASLIPLVTGIIGLIILTLKG